MVSNTYKIIQMHVISIHSTLVSKKSHPTLKSNEKKPGDISPSLSASPMDRARPQLAIPHSISGPRQHGSARQPQQGRQPDEGEEYDVDQSEDRRGEHHRDVLKGHEDSLDRVVFGRGARCQHREGTEADNREGDDVGQADEGRGEEQK